MKKIRIKHAFALFLVGFLCVAPVAAAAGNILAQDIGGEDFFQDLLTNGAEIMLSMVDDQGVPSSIYGQLGIPSDDLAFDDPMYDGCLAMAMISTHGEFLDMVLELVGGDLFGGDNGGEFALAQDGGFDVNSILDMIGTEFNLLINVFVNVDEATSNSRMGQIVTHLQSQFGFSFVELFKLRIDESVIPPEADITLPFDSIDVFIYQETNDFGMSVDSIFSVMDNTGFLGSINTDVFKTAYAAAAGLVAIPDMAELVDLINSFSSEGDVPPLYHVLAQDTDFLTGLEGSIAIAAAGYLGEQEFSTDSTSMNVEELFGITGTVTPLSDANSLIATFLPENLNVTSITPSVEGQSYYNNTEHIVFWNATALGSQSDYIINFEADFPPMITIERVFSPDTTTAGGSTTVTVTISNEGTEPITNLIIADDDLAGTYSTVTVTGTTSDTVATLAGGADTEMEYTVTFSNEGGYGFAPVEISYEYDGNTFYKDSPVDGYTVTPDVTGLFVESVMDGMPYTGLALGVVGLVGLYSIAGLLRGRGGDTFQV